MKCHKELKTEYSKSLAFLLCGNKLHLSLTLVAGYFVSPKGSDYISEWCCEEARALPPSALVLLLRATFPSSSARVKAAELDPVVVDLARGYFGFQEDDRLKVHVTVGIKFVGDASTKVDILIMDVDSPDSSSGMTCPASDFVEESFLKTVKTSLSEEGLFVINLVSRSPAIKEMVISRMKVLEEDVNEVIFALNSEGCTDFTSPEAYNQLQKLLLNVKHPEMTRSIIDSAKKIKPL